MIVSRCCKEKVWIYCGNEGNSFYVCERCDLACDTMTPLELPHKDEPINAEV